MTNHTVFSIRMQAFSKKEYPLFQRILSIISFFLTAAGAVTSTAAAAAAILFHIPYRCKKCNSNDADDNKIQNSHFITSSEEQV